MPEISQLFVRRAELLRQLAGLDEQIGRAFDAELSPVAQAEEALGLEAASALMGEPPETFRRRLEYRKALLSRPGERRLRYSRGVLERIRRDRLSSSAMDGAARG